MGLPPRLALATRNPHKIREILQICADWPVEWVTLETAPIPAVEETEATYAANALLKARATATALGIPALADDSGIEVDALGGAPGPRSARFAGPTATDAENLELLLRSLVGVPSARRTARYRCVAVCDWPGPNGPEGGQLVAEATCEGRIVPVPRGEGGFGYDPAFVPTGMHRTMAELAPREKHEVSHRGKALRALRDMLAADPHSSARDEEPG